MGLFKKISVVVTLLLLVLSLGLSVWSLFLGPQWLLMLVGLCFVAGFSYLSYKDYVRYFKK